MVPATDFRMVLEPAGGGKSNHLDRTAAESRDESLHSVVLEHVVEVNDQIRQFRFGIAEHGPPFEFQPGMWVDLYCPGIAKAGGFSITSTPRDARPGPATASRRGEGEGPGAPAGEAGGPGYFELAVQKSPDNPHAAWLWRSPDFLVGQRVRVRVGGSFVWPPPGASDPDVRLRKVVFVAGGVGVNPLVSMLGALAGGDGDGTAAWDVQFLYSLKDPGPRRRDPARMLFLPRLADLYGSGRLRGRLQLFLTGAGPEPDDDDDDKLPAETLACGEARVPIARRRMTVRDVEAAVGDGAAARDAVVYICGVPAMTDSLVKALQAPDGLAMAPSRVLCEKWW